MEAYDRRNETSGDVILSTLPGVRVWQDYFEICAEADTSEFMADRPLNKPPHKRDIFGTDD